MLIYIDKRENRKHCLHMNCKPSASGTQTPFSQQTPGWASGSAALKSIFTLGRSGLGRGVLAVFHSKLAARAGILPVILGSLLLGGCANMTNHSSGFLGSYENLKPDPKDSHRLVYERTDWKKANYTSVLIEPAVVRLTANDQKKVTATEISELAGYNDKALRKAFEKDWKIVTAAEPGTLRVRSAITGVDTCNPVLNVATALMGCPVDNGGVSMEYEVRDASNGEQLVALAGYSNSTPLEGLWAFTRLGEAHFAIDHWSAALRKIVHPTVRKIAAK
ncbi:MAG: DUF3313 domain-containing protein [Opitutae bacterium]